MKNTLPLIQYLTTEPMMLSWVILLVCLWAPAHSQLGEDREGRDMEANWELPPPREPTDEDYYDEVVYDGVHEFNEKNVRGSVPLKKTIESTYQGCLSENYISSGTFLYINLTEISVENKPERCFNICLIHDPFSMYVTHDLGLDGDNDACGCHDEDELQLIHKEEDDTKCDEDETLYRVYCGPENTECLNKADVMASCALHMLIIPTLITTLINNR